MATRSIISVPATEGYLTRDGSTIRICDERITWFGRYCHWDGYPEHMVPVIQALVKRFGLEGAKTRLMANSWSTLGTDGQAGSLDIAKLGDKDPIGTYSYKTDPFLVDGGDDMGTEYRYLIKHDGTLDIFSIPYDSREHALLNTVQLDGAAILSIVK